MFVKIEQTYMMALQIPLQSLHPPSPDWIELPESYHKKKLNTTKRKKTEIHYYGLIKDKNIQYIKYGIIWHYMSQTSLTDSYFRGIFKVLLSTGKLCQQCKFIVL